LFSENEYNTFCGRSISVIILVSDANSNRNDDYTKLVDEKWRELENNARWENK